MELNDLIKIKLKNDLLREINQMFNEELDQELLSQLIHTKINENPININDDNSSECKLDDCERCCARVMGKFYSDKRCTLKKVEGDYCKKHSKRIKNFGYLEWSRYDEPRPAINEKGNKIPWRDESKMDDINTIIQYQNMKLCKLINS